jgi:hypothetical protein
MQINIITDVQKRLLVGAGIVLLLVYFPAFAFDFGIHNDYFAWTYPHTLTNPFPETAHLVIIGRPVGALLLNVHFFFINSITDLAVSRAISFTVNLISACILYRYLTTRLSLDGYWSLSISIGLILLPAVQLYILWATNFVPGTLNILISFWLYRYLDRVHNLSLKSLPNLLTALIIFLLGCLIYPPTALAFLIFPLARILFTSPADWPRTRKRVVRDIVFSLIGMLVFYLLIKTVYFPFFLHGPESGAVPTFDAQRYQFKASFLDLPHKFFILQDLTRLALKLWNASSIDWITVLLWIPALISLIIIGVMWLRKGRVSEVDAKPRGYNAYYFQMGCAILVLLLTANGPALAAAGTDLAQFRFIYVYSAMLVLLFIWPIYRLTQYLAPHWRSALIVIPVSIGMVSAIFAWIHVVNVAGAASEELSAVRQIIAESDFLETDAVLVILPPREGEFKNQQLMRDFGLSAIMPDYYGWGLHRIVLQELGLARKEIDAIKFTVVSSDDQNEIMVDPCQTILINGNDLKSYWEPKYPELLPHIISTPSC